MENSQPIAAAAALVNDGDDNVDDVVVDMTTTPILAFHDMKASELLALGDCYQIDENLEGAVDSYAAALVLFRESETVLHIRTLSHRSEAFYKMCRYEEALEDAQQSLQLLSTKQRCAGLYPSEGEICHRRAGLAALHLFHYQQAKEYMQKAAQLASLNGRDDQVYVEWIRQCDAKLHKQPVVSTMPVSGSVASTVTPMTDRKAAPHCVQQPKTPPPPSSSSSSSSMVRSTPPITTPKYQYYQSDKFVTISILEAQVKQEDLNVRMEPQHLVVTLRKQGKDFTVVAGSLYREIDPTKSKINIKDEKVLVKLRKIEENYDWPELMGKVMESNTKKVAPNDDKSSGDEDTPSKNNNIPTVPKTSSKPRPYVSHRDWDAIEKNIIAEEKNEKPQGDEAMNKLFQQIYANASDDTKRAMIKSYQTSGGTVLSTNWDEVKQKDYEKERTAPKGQEWKSWEGEKLPMKDDD